MFYSGFQALQVVTESANAAISWLCESDYTLTDHTQASDQLFDRLA